MSQRRYELTDFEWSVIEPLLPNKPRGVPRVDHPPRLSSQQMSGKWTITLEKHALDIDCKREQEPRIPRSAEGGTDERLSCH